MRRLVTAVAILLALPASARAGTASTTFTADGAFVVPAGVTTMDVSAVGAPGSPPQGFGLAEESGAGAFVIGEMTTAPGRHLTITVGEGGGAPGAGSSFGARGGAGGGLAEVVDDTSGRIVVVAAGGGGAGGSTNSDFQPGGDAGAVGSAGTGSGGSGGGGATHDDRGQGGAAGGSGAPGTTPPTAGQDGGNDTGGTGGNGVASGGGGGAGFQGGGGAGAGAAATAHRWRPPVAAVAARRM